MARKRVPAKRTEFPKGQGLRPKRAIRWDLSPTEARAVQDDLRSAVRATRLRWRGLSLVAGCDVAVAGDRLVAGVMVFSLPDLELVETATAVKPARFPYIPGLLSFREIPVLLEALGKLRRRPQVILCDGQGRAHPRRFGLASHLGVLLDLPTVGCAKSRLIGEHKQPGKTRGSWTPLLEEGEVLGVVLRTRTNVRPLYVSPGHLLTLSDAIRLVLACGGNCRLPEPTRRADQLVGRLAREAKAREGR